MDNTHYVKKIVGPYLQSIANEAATIVESNDNSKIERPDRKKGKRKNVKNPSEFLCDFLAYYPEEFSKLITKYTHSGDVTRKDKDKHKEGKYGGTPDGKAVSSLKGSLEIREHRITKLRKLRQTEIKKHNSQFENVWHLSTEKDMCYPDDFSNSITKRLFRKTMHLSMDSDVFEHILAAHSSCAKVHILERLIQQEVADASEIRYLLAHQDSQMHDTVLLFPTLKHQSGDDFLAYDKETKKFTGIDIKTSRYPTSINFFNKNPRSEAMKDPKEACKQLYEHQGAGRFSTNARLYLVMPPSNEEPLSIDGVKEQIEKNEKYNFNFRYHKNDYEVRGAQIIFF